MDDFERFYSLERDGLVRALALVLNDVDAASEAVDEAMARAYQRWRKISHYDSPAGWVYRVALNCARNTHRRRRRPVPRVEPRREPEVADPSIAAALTALDDGHRSVVILRHYLDWTVDQIAEALEVPAGTVKSRLHRAHASLANELEHIR